MNKKIKLYLVNETESNVKQSSRKLSFTVEHFQKHKTKNV